MNLNVKPHPIKLFAYFFNSFLFICFFFLEASLRGNIEEAAREEEGDGEEEEEEEKGEAQKKRKLAFSLKVWNLVNFS